MGAEIEQCPVAHPAADALGEHQPVASDGLAVLVGVGPGGLDVQGAGEGLAMCCPDTRAGAPGKGDIDATTKSWPHKRVPGTHIHHIEVQAMEEPNMCCSQTANIPRSGTSSGKKLPTWAERLEALVHPLSRYSATRRKSIGPRLIGSRLSCCCNNPDFRILTKVECENLDKLVYGIAVAQ